MIVPNNLATQWFGDHWFLTKKQTEKILIGGQTCWSAGTLFLFLDSRERERFLGVDFPSLISSPFLRLSFVSSLADLPWGIPTDDGGWSRGDCSEDSRILRMAPMSCSCLFISTQYKITHISQFKGSGLRTQKLATLVWRKIKALFVLALRLQLVTQTSLSGLQIQGHGQVSTFEIWSFIKKDMELK